MQSLTPIRQHLVRLLQWEDAHTSFDGAVADFPAHLRGRRPDGFPHSAWELVEHLRVTQRDILDFCLPGAYRERDWPAGYWPETEAPPSEEVWDATISAYRADRDALAAIAADPDVDLTQVVPHGTDQTYLREILLVADHNAYHVGQLVLLRRALGIWPAG
jgi:uncharacterized damage-inducible protein DinB